MTGPSNGGSSSWKLTTSRARPRLPELSSGSSRTRRSDLALRATYPFIGSSPSGPRRREPGRRIGRRGWPCLVRRPAGRGYPGQGPVLAGIRPVEAATNDASTSRTSRRSRALAHTLGSAERRYTTQRRSPFWRGVEQADRARSRRWWTPVVDTDPPVSVHRRRSRSGNIRVCGGPCVVGVSSAEPDAGELRAVGHPAPGLIPDEARLVDTLAVDELSPLPRTTHRSRSWQETART